MKAAVASWFLSCGGVNKSVMPQYSQHMMVIMGDDYRQACGGFKDNCCPNVACTRTLGMKANEGRGCIDSLRASLVAMSQPPHRLAAQLITGKPNMHIHQRSL